MKLVSYDIVSDLNSVGGNSYQFLVCTTGRGA